MNMKDCLTVVAVFVLVVAICVAAIPSEWFGNWFENKVEYIDQKIDDATNYETIKKVEDTCRAMIASYDFDKMTYKQYKDSPHEERQFWAEQAKMRANNTASTYNNYMLKNSFVWKGNIPIDIKEKLDYIE